MAKVLNIAGKSINIEKLAGKTEAQFRQQLRQNGLNLTDEQFTNLWGHLQKSLTVAAKHAAENKEA